jgi:hypothetical protein
VDSRSGTNPAATGSRALQSIGRYIDEDFDKEPGTYDIFDPDNYAIYDERFVFAASFSEDYKGFAKVKLEDDPNFYFINTKGAIVFGQTEDGSVVVEPTDVLMEFLLNQYAPPRE